MGYSITDEPPAQCVYGAKSTPLHETDTVPERYQEDENTCEIEAGSIYAEGFAIVATKVMRDKDISTRAKGLYSYLMTFVGQPASAWPDLDRVSNEMGLKKTEIPALLAELHSHGSISIEIKEAIR